MENNTNLQRVPIKDRYLKKLAFFTLKILVIALAVFILFNFIIGVTICHSNDNYPMVHDGDLLIYIRTGKVEDYYAGDLIIYKANGETRVARVAAVPSDKVEISETEYLVNGFLPYESVYYETKPQNANLTYPYSVPTGKVFVLNDYRIAGTDSRTYGAVVPLGKVIFQMRHRGF